MGTYANELLYFMGGRDTASGVSITDVVFTFDGQDTYTTTDYIIINGKKNELYIYIYYYGAVITHQANELVVAPDGMELDTYTLSYQTYNSNNKLVKASGFVNIGTVGDDVYMQHIWDVLPDAWVKGRMVDGKMVFDGPQFLGYYEADNERLPAYFIPFDLKNGDLLGQVTFSNNRTTGTLEAVNQAIGICLNRARLLTFIEIRTPQLTLIPDVAIVPANPKITNFVGTEQALPYIEVHVPGKGANGETLNPNKLSYQLLGDIEHDVQPLVLTTDLYERLPYDMEAIPWLYADDYDVTPYSDDNYMVYLNMPIDQLNRIGVQSIYTGGGETLRSDSYWVDIKDFTTGIKDISLTADSGLCHDLQGRLVATPKKGLYIVDNKKVIIK